MAYSFLKKRNDFFGNVLVFNIRILVSEEMDFKVPNNIIYFVIPDGLEY